MFAVRSKSHRQAIPFSLGHILWLSATWLQLAHARPQSGVREYVPILLGSLGLIPSVARSALIPSAPAPVQSQADSTRLVPSSALLLETASLQLSLLSLSSIAILPSTPTNLPTPSAPLTSSRRPIPSFPSDASVVITPSRSGATGKPVMQSTNEDLRPIPPAATQPGDPNGHHEITEPNFTATKTCRGCSPFVEIPATGWLDSLAEEPQGPSSRLIRTNVIAGPSNLLISQAPSGGNFVIGGSATVTPGQTIIVDNVPVAIQTSAGKVEVVIGTTVIPLNPDAPKSYKKPQVTHTPTSLPVVITIGSETISANSQGQYIVSGQTLQPGGTAITISGTTISLAPSATAVIINGISSALTPNFGNIWTISAAALTFKNQVYTANRAGYITIGPGTVLKPGGEAITVDGIALSLDNSGTVVVVQGNTSILKPAITVVTLTKSVGAGVGGGRAGYTSGGSWTLPTTKAETSAKLISAGGTLSPNFVGDDAWLGGLMMLVWWSLGFLAVGL
ncbi:hypothetical protein GQ44DRAFT_457890 [Phaeosphaeriaceae sp. PMI808]|nr:hypothetical protein GQ44DRAFT_457890 [Phaeosphaeriaceae sp. PMI808]